MLSGVASLANQGTSDPCHVSIRETHHQRPRDVRLTDTLFLVLCRKGWRTGILLCRACDVVPAAATCTSSISRGHANIPTPDAGIQGPGRPCARLVPSRAAARPVSMDKSKALIPCRDEDCLCSWRCSIGSIGHRARPPGESAGRCILRRYSTHDTPYGRGPWRGQLLPVQVFVHEHNAA